MHNIFQKIIYLYRKIYNKLTNRQKLNFYVVLFLAVICSFNEAVSVGMIYPFISVLLDINMILKNEHILTFFSFIGFTDYVNLKLYITIIFFSSVALSGALKIMLINTNLRLGQSINHNMSCNLYLKNLYLDYEEGIKINTSETISLVKFKSGILTFSFFLQINTLLSSFIICFSMLTILVFINYKIAAGSFFIFGAFYFLVTYFVRSKMSLYAKTLNELEPKSIKLLNEGLGGRKEIILNYTQFYYEKLFKNVDYIFKRISTNIKIMSLLPKVFIETFALMVLTILAYIISLTVDSFNSVLPLMGAFVLAAQKLLPQFQQMYSSWIGICSSLNSVDDVLSELNRKTNIVKQNMTKAINFKKDIEFKNVEYSYLKNKKLILNNFHMKIKKGDKVGLIGPTGSGKSTFLDLFMGLLTPNKGSVIVDNKRLNKNNIKNWQSNISHVPQSIFLADISIIENIAIGIPLEKINKKSVIEAAKKAQLHQVIESWNDGYETIIGENGISLSGGQRQRIGLARFFYKHKPVLILDEATSALDVKTEKKVVEAFPTFLPSPGQIVEKDRIKLNFKIAN